MAKPDQTITDASASTDTTTYTLVNCSPATDAPGSRADGHQVCRVGGSCNASTGSATVRFVLRSAARVHKVVDVTFTPSAVRTAPAGSSGDYVASVAATSNDWIDLYGADAGLTGDPLKWYVGVSAFTTVSSVQIDLYFSRAF